jgi:hypothetical protein
MHGSPIVPSPEIAQLQRSLRDRFPKARHGIPPEPFAENAPFDFRNPASFPQGAITEICPAKGGGGLSLLLAAFLSEEEDTPAPLPEFALIDANTFDPTAFSPNACSKLLWARCHSVEETLKAADLLLRDGNLPRILLDLTAFPPSELRKAPGPAWQRLKQLSKASDCSLLALTPRPLVPCAALRLTLHSDLRLEDLDSSRKQLIESLSATTEIHRRKAR